MNINGFHVLTKKYFYSLNDYKVAKKENKNNFDYYIVAKREIDNNIKDIKEYLFLLWENGKISIKEEL
jgi:hypothetical protein